MDQRWIALAAALALTGTLTACGGNDNKTPAQPENPVTNSGMENEVQGSQTTPENSVTDTVPNESNLEDNAINDRGGVDPRARTAAKSNRNTLTRRTAYDYLKDGKYATDEAGRVKPDKNKTGNDLTQGARDLIRDGANAVRRAGQDVGNMTRDMLQ